MWRKLHTIGGKLSMGMSFIGTGLLIWLVLVDTKYELSIQNIYFIWCSILLLFASIFTTIFIDKRPKLSVIDSLVALFGMLIVVNYKFITPVNAEGKFITFIFLGLVYIALRVIFSSYKNAFHLVIIAVVFCGLIEAIYGFSQLMGLGHSRHSLYRMTGTFFNPGPYGGYLSIIMSISVAYIIIALGLIVIRLNILINLDYGLSSQ